MKNGRQIYLRLLDYGRKYWFVFSIGVLAMLIFAVTDTGFAFLIKILTDSFAGNVESFDTGELKWVLPIGVIIIFIIRGVSGFFSTYNMSWISRHVIRRVRSDVYQKFLYLPTSFLDQKSNAELLSKVIFNIEQVSESTANVLTVLIRDSLTIIALTIYMIYLSPMLSAVIFTAAPVIALIVKILSTLFRKYSERIQDSMGDVTHSIKETLQNHRIIKIFNGQEDEGSKFGEINEINRRHHMKLLRTKAIGDALTIFVASLGVAGVVYVATLNEVKSSMTVGDFSGFITAMVLLMTPLKRLTNVNAMIQRGIAAAASIFNLLDEGNELDEGTNDAKRLSGSIQFKDVNFSYSPDKEILKNINTMINAGQTIAVVGKSGSGKSTLVNLIPRFYDIESGCIEIDDLPIETYTLQSLRSNISLVTQEVTLFNDTIENNIVYGGHSKHEINDAIKASHIDEFIDDLPDGLQTRVGDQGILLSGGQRQRIAIARAMLKDAPILILDEATSALDSESEKLIQKAFDRLMENRTTFVIAHRLSTIENADRILVLSNGQIIEEGTHDELLIRDGEYAFLHKMQFND
ncbi:MAG: lipid A export permease/ATP-binding protein MsbA [Gammaproteobacteria bacterium]|jgi:subfamily B ATP-binding cassette protein MsbA|nr:lipid A export permease/ATP-binding protein MsbA [Gammaproteobacteria bacterium]MBQ09177.1 lipid A export permease/ATP-binding protein MsbA [Gammaproteobacteria bacterium]MDP6146497.1 lipid A export permease/ATP-binding protein MsbA [Gammaproteobacteria bacterium]HJL80775.1 lipid A export permease/ATP-binding protein MsbA [Gammaproteobacteria bacterium]HJM08780.1 lipid A export permease/ATP-binding protein MsbA [Gammaproteobacteria bacterium]|tara:strand:- start:25289 stop:27022 length:1734 start_codon:yes stop_codon:yes gene_type:complete